MFAYTMNQDADGFLWISTSEGLCRFDGMVFETAFRGDTLPESIAHVSLLDSHGRLWFGFENGYLAVWNGSVFKVLRPFNDENLSRVNAIREDEETGNILALCQQSGLLIFDAAYEILHERNLEALDQDPFAGLFLYDFQITDSGNLLVGSQNGLVLYLLTSEGEYELKGFFEDLHYMGVPELVATPFPNEFWAGTEDEGVFRIKGNGNDLGAYSSRKIGVGTGLEYAGIGSMVFDGPLRVWIYSKGVGVFRFALDAHRQPGNGMLFNEKNGLPANYLNEVYLDDEGNQWFSTPGNGISVLRDQAFTFYSIWGTEGQTDISSLYMNDSYECYGGESTILLNELTGQKRSLVLDVKNGLPNDRVNALYMDRDNNLYIGTAGNGLYLKRNGSNRVNSLVRSGNSLSNIIHAIDGLGSMLYVATNNGAYSLDMETGLRTEYNTYSEVPLPHNRINDVLVDSNGRAWAATLYYGLVEIGSDVRINIDGRPKLELKSLTEDSDGYIWAGTYGDGVYRFDLENNEWKKYTEDQGLKSNYTYALQRDPLGNIWVGHRKGLSCIDPEKEHIRSYGRENGFDSDVRENAVTLNREGKMVFGSTGGIIEYDAYQSRDDGRAPKLNLKSVQISGVSYDPREPIKLKYGKYRVRIDYVGIHLSNPEQVTYQYMLEGDEEEWSEPTRQNYAYYGRVEDGSYTFLLKACDGIGNCTIEPLKLEISVRIPIWKTWWFIVSAIVLLLLIIFTVFKIRERNQKAIQEYLQRQLDERTREVVQQKEEIEIKNRDITDSLNYAQRIQASILPPIKKLHDAFAGSFVFYQPRDIVSGDFYWYEKMGNDKFIIVCADSTGHGVPGAFMSMIGTTLIKDICMRSDVHTPSEVLFTLDNEVRQALNQNMEASGSNDGMDIIVAEIDLKTNKFRVSSAMRPVIIYTGDEQIYVKGSRSSIGGQLDEDRMEKEFFDQEFQLKKGDTIYMFSDGYPDQFGGPLGRKFKMVRLKNLLKDIHSKNMDEQYSFIKSNFYLWKEDLEQVDDVLFMGIRL